MDGLNDFRTARVAEVLSDFHSIQYCITAFPVDPPDMDDYYTEGWTALRQCHLDGQRILNCGADTSVPETSGGPEEQAKAELKQILLDAFARRHEAQKIFLRQAAAQRWIEYRAPYVLVGRPNSGNSSPLRRCDQQLRAELEAITDEVIYAQLLASDLAMGRWTAENPSLRAVQRWVRTRR
ncbi:hypothetical protein VPNG_08420 [Cytospora leucostoma]|uniref:Uncharacterized protein n=1 Tax=Cytospora leucostoma TaxID=1230097 RepID=A0A423W6D9_9PEZI|nr:hypothetical protein VPNG_08420 [Cytospora leucostoma]